MTPSDILTGEELRALAIDMIEYHADHPEPINRATAELYAYCQDQGVTEFGSEIPEAIDAVADHVLV